MVTTKPAPSRAIFPHGSARLDLTVGLRRPGPSAVYGLIMRARTLRLEKGASSLSRMQRSARLAGIGDEPAFSNCDSPQKITPSPIRLGRLLVGIAAQGIDSMLLHFIGLLTLTRVLKPRIWAPAIEQLAYLWGNGLSDEMPIHFAQLIVDHPS